MPEKFLNSDVRAEHFKAFFKYAAIGIVVTTTGGDIIAINPFALKRFGYSQEELSGRYDPSDRMPGP